MTSELQQAYRASAVPFKGLGCFDEKGDFPRPWRVFLEVNSACNLHCISCTKGNKDGYEHKNGYMDWSLMEKILDKIVSENPSAIVFLYGNSEPFLHPHLPEVISEVKKRGLRCELSTNLNYVRRLDDLIAAAPSFIIVSLSGFTQEIYARSHCGGDIEKVKLNLKLMAEANSRAERKVDISVSFHHYNDNGHEIEPMRQYAESLGLGFFVTNARIISMENAIQYLREKESIRTGNEVPYVGLHNGINLNHALPPVTDDFRKVVARLNFSPEQAQAKYAHIPDHQVCPVGSLFLFIRHDGEAEMCACVADRRLVLGKYLDLTQDQLDEKRQGNALCKLCTRYKLRYYFHNVEDQGMPSPLA